jgi:hypothetical protein
MRKLEDINGKQLIIQTKEQDNGPPKRVKKPSRLNINERNSSRLRKDNSQKSLSEGNFLAST